MKSICSNEFLLTPSHYQEARRKKYNFTYKNPLIILPNTPYHYHYTYAQKYLIKLRKW